MATTPNIDPVGFLGREFIGYVANCQSDVVDEALRNPAHAEHVKVSEAVGRCRSVLAQHGTRVHEVIASVPSGYDVSVGNAMRLASGGELPSIPTENGIVRTLGRIARDVFPSLLLAPTRELALWGGPTSTPSHRLLSRAIGGHPAADEFQRSLAADDLSDLFGIQPPPAFFSFSTGTGQAVEPSSLPLGLLGAASARVRLTQPAFTFEALVDHLHLLVGALREVQANGTCSIPIVVGLHGLNSHPGVLIDLPWGWLRSMDSPASNAVGDAFPELGALLITPVECEVAVGSATATDNMVTSGNARQTFNSRLEERIQKTMLTMLFAEQQPRLGPVPTNTVAISPFFGTGWGASNYGPTPVPGPAGTLTSEHIGPITALASLVDDRYADALAIPTRRFISALSSRHDIEDGLVDAVVAWESLFAGTDVGELRFRIAAAMAWLIGRDAEQRLELHREIARLYDTRSQILHRGRARRDVTQERDRAVELGVKALQALLEDHPDLVSDENRGKKLIMTGGF